MKFYNFYYKAGNKVIDKKHITKEEVDEILKTLTDSYESELRVIQIKDRDDEEER